MNTFDWFSPGNLRKKHPHFFWMLNEKENLNSKKRCSEYQSKIKPANKQTRSRLPGKEWANLRALECSFNYQRKHREKKCSQEGKELLIRPRRWWEVWVGAGRPRRHPHTRTQITPLRWYIWRVSTFPCLSDPPRPSSFIFSMTEQAAHSAWRASLAGAKSISINEWNQANKGIFAQKCKRSASWEKGAASVQRHTSRHL